MSSIDHIFELRRQLHAHPDVSGQESFAHDLIVCELQRLQPTMLYDHVGGFGVVAYFAANQGNGEGTLAFRADIDALPIGHRCGHDGHTAILLHFAQMLAAMPRHRDVVLIFQPEEETGYGARKIVESGLLQRHQVRAVFGLHNLPGFPMGTVVLNRGTFAAASTGVVYHLEGRPTHASTPEKGINPGLAVADLIHCFQQFNSGDIVDASFRQSTLICCRIGEEAFGTSAGEGSVMFTLRAYTNKAMDQLLADADAAAQDAAKRYGLQLRRSLRDPFSATENDPVLVDRMRELFLQDGIEPQMVDRPFRWSEDFAEYQRHFRGAFFGVGSGENQPELHHPDYVFPDALIEPAARCFLNCLNITL